MNKSAYAARRLPGAHLAVVLFSLVALVSCSREEVASFAWQSASGSRLSFVQTAGVAAGQENLLSAALSKNSYILKSPLEVERGFMVAVSVNVKREGLALGFSLSPGSRKENREAKFAAMPGRTLFYLGIPDKGVVKSLSVELAPRGDLALDPKDQSVLAEIESVSVLPAFRGYEKVGEGDYRVSDGISIERAGASSELWTLEKPFEAAAPLQSALVVKYAANIDASEGRVVVQGGVKVLARCGSARKKIVLPASIFPEGPGRDRATVSVPDAIKVEAVYAEALPAEAASLVDPGTLLLEPPLSGKEDFAWCRWDLLPDVIAFDFRDYATQDRYLKRLAFFVEKKGFAGRLATNEEIAALHGWNAHDYKSDDIARFFSAAAKTGFALNAEELRFRDFLVEKGMLVRKGGEFAARNGAIISITQESPAYLRHTFLTHESSHAIFFTDAAYRDFCISLWNAMSREERWFWYIYFGWMNYDTSSSYLMANELQAYLVQQPPSLAAEYFTKKLPSRVMEHHPELKAAFAQYMAAYGAEFERKSGRIDGWLRAKYGFGAGTTFFVQ